MRTERLYYEDSHLTEFDARVTSVAPADGGRSVVTLDRTAFYPTGGGQPTDTGALGAARVVECVDAEEEGVLHFIEGEAPAPGAAVRGRVDWPRRLDHIQQHTGQHILSQALVELFGAQTRRFRMMAGASEIDVDLASPSDEKIERAVRRANEIVWADRRLRVHNVTPEEAARMPLRKDSAREGSLRVIEIEGFDFSPCGGTHARRTGEVGLIAARQWERAKGLVRVTFVAGVRALEDYRHANHTARAVAALFSTARDAAADAASRLQAENRKMQRRLRAAEELAARAEAREILEEAEGDVKSGRRGDKESGRRGDGETAKSAAGGGATKAPGGKVTGAESVGAPGAKGVGATGAPSGLRVVVRVFEGRDAEGLRRLAAALAAHACVVALLGSREDAGARLVFARS